MAFTLKDGARLSLFPACAGTFTARQASLDAADRSVAPPEGLLTLHFDVGRFPPGAGSLLPGPLAAARTGLTPAGDDELQNESDHVTISVTPLARWAYSRVPWNFGGDPGWTLGGGTDSGVLCRLPW